MKKKKALDLKAIEAQIEKEFSQINPDVFKCRAWKWTSYNKQSERAHWFDDEEAGWITPTETAINRTKRSATADDDVLRSLVFQYEEALKNGEDPIGTVQSIASKAVEEGLWPKDNLYILWQAIEGGALASKALNPIIGGPSVDKMTPHIRAVQTIVKANPIVVKLPFVQDVLIYLLRSQKYGDKPSDARFVWEGFLHSRTKNKILHSPEAIRRLIKKTEKDKPIDVYGKDEELGSYGIVGKAFGRSESFLKKAIAIKGRGPGRPKKGK